MAKDETASPAEGVDGESQPQAPMADGEVTPVPNRPDTPPPFVMNNRRLMTAHCGTLVGLVVKGAELDPCGDWFDSRSGYLFVKTASTAGRRSVAHALAKALA